MDFEKITEYLDSLEARGIPSVDCMIYRDHELLYRHMNGTTDAKRERKIDGSEVYLMFSMTKVQTMTAVLRLVEQGKLSLEDEVGRYLPAYQKLTVKNANAVEPLTKPLKIKHLLSMQSGLDYDLQRPGILRVLKEKGQAATTLELVNSFAESPLDFVPGEHFQYSLSHDVVAAVIEAVSGMTFGEYLKKNLWEPLGLKNTFFAKPMNDDVPGLAQQFIQNEKGEIVPMEQSCCYQLSENYESGGAGLISCTEDYAVFADALACGGISREGVRILQPETVELMKTNLLGDTSREEIARNMGRQGYGYGCGVQVLMEPEKIGSKAPAGLFGWDGAAASWISMDTKAKVSAVYTQHVRNCGFAYGEIHLKLRDMVFGEE
ncbi:MAG: serine hydrolase [Lachnospiraceae bacterium]|nr:serine hydrolase [Lachnospiraceae bacterium]